MLQDYLDDGVLSQVPVYHHSELGSTQTEANRLCGKHLNGGFVVVADCQTEGRGTNSRGWYSPLGKNLYATLVVPKAAGSVLPPYVSLRFAAEVVSRLNDEFNTRLKVKWPNDIYSAKGYKLSGLLTEAKVSHLLVGWGFNIMADKNRPDELLKKASSLEEGVAGDFDYDKTRARLLEVGYEVLVSLVDNLSDMSWLRLYRDVDFLAGKEVSVVYRGEELFAEAGGITDGGQIILKRAGHSDLRLSSGEVQITHCGS